MAVAAGEQGVQGVQEWLDGGQTGPHRSWKDFHRLMSREGVAGGGLLEMNVVVVFARVRIGFLGVVSREIHRRLHVVIRFRMSVAEMNVSCQSALTQFKSGWTDGGATIH